MDFNHTEERQMLADSLRRTLARGADWAALAELGVLGALFSEEQGGFGGHGFDLAVVFEELGRSANTEPVLQAGLAGGLLADAGDDRVESIVAGSLKATLAFLEPGQRYDRAPLKTRVTGSTVSGAKSAVEEAEGADLILVTALEGDTPVVVAVDPRGPGVMLHTTPALCGGTVSELRLDNAPCTPVAVTPAQLDHRLAAATLMVCADALGAMETAKAMTLDYLRTRTQFGRPIGSFQALQHRMADVAIEIEQARSAVINLAGHLDAAPALRDKHVSATKNLVGRTARLVAEESVQMHGGIAMTEEYALAPITRRLIAADHRFGDEDWHLARFIAASAA